LEVYTAGIQSLEDHIDTALIFFRFILADNRCVDDAVIQS
jgi:hypothetical protein